jgi:hypothetical protein
MFHSLRRLLSLVLIAVGLCSVLIASAPNIASATTGPTKFLPSSKFKINNKIELLYKGQYVLRSVASAARLSGGAMGIEINDSGFLYGVAQFYGYDQQGHQSTWVGTLYNFHQTAKQVMIVDVLGPTGKPLLARLFLSRAKSGDMTGQIELPYGRFAISWHKLSTR